MEDNPFDYVTHAQDIRDSNPESLTDSMKFARDCLKLSKREETPGTCYLFFRKEHRDNFLNHLPSNASRIKWTHSLELCEFGENDRFAAALLPMGASAAVNHLELIRHLGYRNFLALGIAGTPQMEQEFGSWNLIDQAVRDEGTSLHYAKKHSIFSHSSFALSDRIEEILEKGHFQFQRGLGWSTDAPFRITECKLRYWRKKLTCSIDMEASALFSFAQFYKLKMACIHVTGDRMGPNGWEIALHHKIVKDSMQKLLRFWAENYSCLHLQARTRD